MFAVIGRVIVYGLATVGLATVVRHLREINELAEKGREAQDNEDKKDA